MALYDSAIEAAKPYMGPAAEKFMTRQIKEHLGIEPANLTVDNLPDLASWCISSGKLVMGEDKAKELADKVKALK